MFKTLKHVYYVFHKAVLARKLAVALQGNDVEIVNSKRIFLAAYNQNSLSAVTSRLALELKGLL